jgi:hypothetical protein
MNHSTKFTAPSWPNGTGPCGTGWERLQVLCDWLDNDLLFLALCNVDTGDAVLTYRTVAKFEFTEESDMVHFCLAYPNPGDLEWDVEAGVGHLDPCDDPDTLDQWVTSACPSVLLSMATIFEIDMRNKAAYRRFLAGCEKRISQFQGMMPLIDIMVR